MRSFVGFVIVLAHETSKHLRENFGPGELEPLSEQFWGADRDTNNTAEPSQTCATTTGPKQWTSCMTQNWFGPLGRGCGVLPKNLRLATSLRRIVEDVRDGGLTVCRFHVCFHSGHFRNEAADQAADKGSSMCRVGFCPRAGLPSCVSGFTAPRRDVQNPVVSQPTTVFARIPLCRRIRGKNS